MERQTLFTSKTRHVELPPLRSLCVPARSFLFSAVSIGLVIKKEVCHTLRARGFVVVVVVVVVGTFISDTFGD